MLSPSSNICGSFYFITINNYDFDAAVLIKIVAAIAITHHTSQAAQQLV